MSKQMKSAQSEQSNTQTFAERNQNKENSSELLEREPVANTPFHIIGNKVDGYFLAMGKYRLTTVYNSKSEVVEVLEERNWEILCNVIFSTLEAYDVMKKNEG